MENFNGFICDHQHHISEPKLSEENKHFKQAYETLVCVKPSEIFPKNKPNEKEKIKSLNAQDKLFQIWATFKEMLYKSENRTGFDVNILHHVYESLFSTYANLFNIPANLIKVLDEIQNGSPSCLDLLPFFNEHAQKMFPNYLRLLTLEEIRSALADTEEKNTEEIDMQDSENVILGHDQSHRLLFDSIDQVPTDSSHGQPNESRNFIDHHKAMQIEPVNNENLVVQLNVNKPTGLNDKATVEAKDNNLNAKKRKAKRLNNWEIVITMLKNESACVAWKDRSLLSFTINKDSFTKEFNRIGKCQMSYANITRGFRYNMQPKRNYFKQQPVGDKTHFVYTFGQRAVDKSPWLNQIRSQVTSY